ncbi:MAG: cyanoexosortase B system-associated protein [Alkalinema sp. RU_4_3]|nr:cyanoexosortase B system-associated protein [Alkalinema sp. RU_4_3]
MASVSFSKSRSLPRAKLVLLVLLAGLFCLGALPGYFQGQWRWKNPPLVSTLRELQEIKRSGVAVDNWTVSEVTPMVIGEHKWVQQTLTQGNQSARVLLLPQGSNTRQPQVEWMDVDGLERWKQDSHQSLNLSGDIQTRFFRAWTNKQTYGVVQWYALPQGGVTTPAGWFWRDRTAQWQNRRVSWVAVSILIKMEPLDDLSKYRQTAESLVQSVQSGLMRQALKP